ncbi:MAG: uncharacterized protein QOG84_583 [Sphingomonadales bacterium]|jgi:pimeloyl-ACP methyl ester carboxylesterase|nr:uncharacterized protein [Sphingomonadales bacterium]
MIRIPFARALAVLLLLAFAPSTAATAQPGQPATAAADPSGDWLGVLALGGNQLHLAFHFRRNGTALSGTMDSLDQAAMGLPLANVRAEGGTLAFDVPAVGGHYSGAWDASAAGYAGEWNQATIKLPLALARGGAPARPVVQGLDGNWDGKLMLGTMGSLRLVFHIETTAAGTVAAMQSPDQGPGIIPFTAIARDGGKVVLEAPAIGGRFEGTLSADQATMTGRWSQGGQETPLEMKRRPADAPPPAALNRPQMPRRPYPYREIEVGYDNIHGGNRLAGTLTVPPGAGPFPAALLITGSGPQDRDETLMGHKPFLVLADYLTRRGIAVLRVDDRGVGASTGDFARATSADFATDVEAGIAFLQTRPEIDRHRIGLVGHSEGGLIAPLVAARNPGVAWVVMMAGPGVRGDRIIVSQERLIAAAAGVPAAQLDKNEALEQRLLSAVENAPDAETARTQAKALLVAQNMSDRAATAAAAAVSSDWYRGFLRYDPAAALRQLRVPVLAIAGSLDLQVPPEENLAAIRSALAADRDATAVELPGLNHLFQTAKTGAVAEYMQIEETIAPIALKTVGDWIVAHTR